MKTKFIVGALALIAMASPALAAHTSNWQVSEGVNASTKGVWTVTFEHRVMTGQADMTTITNQRLGYKLEGSADHGEFTFTRTVSSDGQICVYHGKMTPDRTMIQGSVSCGEKRDGWVAIPSIGEMPHMRRESEREKD